MDKRARCERRRTKSEMRGDSRRQKGRVYKVAISAECEGRSFPVVGALGHQLVYPVWAISAREARRVALDMAWDQRIPGCIYRARMVK